MIAARLAKNLALKSLQSQVRLAMPLMAAQQRFSLMAFSTPNMLLAANVRSFSTETTQERVFETDERIPRY